MLTHRPRHTTNARRREKSGAKLQHFFKIHKQLQKKHHFFLISP